IVPRHVAFPAASAGAARSAPPDEAGRGNRAAAGRGPRPTAVPRPLGRGPRDACQSLRLADDRAPAPTDVRVDDAVSGSVADGVTGSALVLQPAFPARSRGAPVSRDVLHSSLAVRQLDCARRRGPALSQRDPICRSGSRIPIRSFGSAFRVLRYIETG